ncbi:MAG: hypothetical protein ACYC6I_11415 [Bacillota bacterium]
MLEGRTYTTSVDSWTDRERGQCGGEDPFPRKTYVLKNVARDGNIVTAQLS